MRADDDDDDDEDDYDDDQMVTQTIQSPFQLFTFCYFFALDLLCKSQIVCKCIKYKS